MATVNDELWSLGQRTRGLNEFLSELRIMWNDSAAHEISTRYLIPRGDDDSRMQRALAEQQEALEELQGHVSTVLELASAAASLSRDIAQLLGEAMQEASTANGYFQTFSEFNNNALNLFPQVQEKIQQANSACAGIPAYDQNSNNSSISTSHTKPTGTKGGKPSGAPATYNEQDDEATKRGRQRENESANTLAAAGYKVQQNPKTLPNGKKPDFDIENNIFDNYAPSTSKAYNIVSNIRSKVISGQSSRIVLNLNDSSIALDTLRQALAQRPIPGLEEIIVIKNGNIFPFYP